MKKKIFKIISKIALFLVVFGFFQPIACSRNGFELAKDLMNYESSKLTIASFGLYAVFFAALLSIIFTIILLMSKQNICSKTAFTTDLILQFISIIGGVIAYLILLEQIGKDSFNNGAYYILAGWIISFIFLLGSIEKDK